MLTVKYYKRPLSAISIGGENIRLTPGVLATFSKPLADKHINIYGVSTGEYNFCFFIDEIETERATLLLSDIVMKSSHDITVRKNIGMVSITGPELINTPGLLHRLLKPLSQNKINILAITTTFDSDLLFFDYKDAKRAYEILNNYIPEKIAIFKSAKDIVKGVIKKIIR